MTTQYDPAVHPRQLQLLCERGATTREIADFFNITADALNKWRLEHPEIAEAFISGTEVSDNRVERALYERAVGYTYASEKIVVVSQGAGSGSVVERVSTTEHVPPDVKAAVRWLEARRPEVWRKRIAHTGPDGEALNLAASEFDISKLTPDERKQFRYLLTSTQKSDGK